MKVTVSGIAPHDRGLQMGLVIHGPKNSWIRFASVLLEVPNLGPLERRALVQALSIGLPEVHEDLDQELPGLDI